MCVGLVARAAHAHAANDHPGNEWTHRGKIIASVSCEDQHLDVMSGLCPPDRTNPPNQIVILNIFVKATDCPSQSSRTEQAIARKQFDAGKQARVVPGDW